MILLYLVYFLISSAYSITPLRYGYDSSQNDIQIIYSGNGTRFYLTVNPHITQSSVKLCFRQRPIINGQIKASCKLDNSLSGYDCLELYFKSNTSFYWKADSNLKALTQSTPFYLGSYSNHTFTICSLDGIINGSGTFNFISKINTIYEVAAIPYDISRPIISYAQTFSASNSLRTENILFPSQALCYSHQNINHLIFLGGVIRNQVKTYLASFLSYHQKGRNFSFWGGLSFSQDKVRRDMLGVFPQVDNFADLYSIYATAPFKDISLNINGSQNWSIISSSYRATLGEKSSYYFMSLSRPYFTEDKSGDENIIPKINNRYCFVGWTSQSIDIVVSEPYIDKSYMHTILECFTPDLKLYLELLSISCTSMILIMLI